MEERRVFTREEKQEVLKKCKCKCAHCGTKLSLFGDARSKRISIDHFIPLSKGGTNELRNLVGLCEGCNTDKANHTMEAQDYYGYLDMETITEFIRMKADYERDMGSENAHHRYGLVVNDIISLRILSEHGKKYIDIIERKRKKKSVTMNDMDRFSSIVTLKKAYYEDLDRLYYFLLENTPGGISKDELKESMIKDFQNSFIYYVLNKKNEIIVVFTFGLAPMFLSLNDTIKELCFKNPVFSKSLTCSKHNLAYVYYEATCALAVHVGTRFNMPFIDSLYSYHTSNTLCEEVFRVLQQHIDITDMLSKDSTLRKLAECANIEEDNEYKGYLATERLYRKLLRTHVKIEKPCNSDEDTAVREYARNAKIYFRVIDNEYLEPISAEEAGLYNSINKEQGV